MLMKVKMRSGFMWLTYGPVTGFCQYDNEPTDMRPGGGEFLGQSSGRYLPNRQSSVAFIVTGWLGIQLANYLHIHHPVTALLDHRHPRPAINSQSSRKPASTISSEISSFMNHLGVTSY
jgi:hypothetical protein